MFGTSTGFELMASASALQCSNQLSYEGDKIMRRPICGVHLNPCESVLDYYFVKKLSNECVLHFLFLNHK